MIAAVLTVGVGVLMLVYGMRKYLLFTGTLIAILVAIFIAYAEKAPLYRLADGLHLIPRDEALTELYLDDHHSLPHAIRPGEVIPFSFTIHNLEGQNVQYQYNVYARLSSGRQIAIGTGTAALANSEFKTISELYIYNAASLQVTIFVELPDQHQSIHFTLPNKE